LRLACKASLRPTWWLSLKARENSWVIGVWADERNLADEQTLMVLADGVGLPAQKASYGRQE
jgi:hypothetical protein